jgi:hypothetical protein
MAHLLISLILSAKGYAWQQISRFKMTWKSKKDLANGRAMLRKSTLADFYLAASNKFPHDDYQYTSNLFAHDYRHLLIG